MNAKIIETALVILAQTMNERHIVATLGFLKAQRIPRRLLAGTLEEGRRFFALQNPLDALAGKMKIIQKIIDHKGLLFAGAVDNTGLSRQDALNTLQNERVERELKFVFFLKVRSALDVIDDVVVIAEGRFHSPLNRTRFEQIGNPHPVLIHEDAMVDILPLFHELQGCKESLVEIAEQLRLDLLKFFGFNYLLLVFESVPTNHIHERGRRTHLLLLLIEIIPNPVRTLKEFIEMLPGEFIWLGAWHEFSIMKNSPDAKHQGSLLVIKFIKTLCSEKVQYVKPRHGDGTDERDDDDQHDREPRRGLAAL